MWQTRRRSRFSPGIAAGRLIHLLKEVNSQTGTTVRSGLAIQACSIVVLCVGALDYHTGVEVSFSIFYLVPVSAAAWLFGPRAGALVAVLSAATWMVVEVVVGGKTYSHPIIPVWNTAMRLGVFLIVAGMLSRLLITLEKERQATHELNEAHAALDHTRKQQLLFKDQLLSHVSHELRTPLTALHQFITIPLDGLLGPMNDEQKESLQVALKNVKQLEHMIRDLVESTRADVGKLVIEPAPTLVAPVVAELIRTLRSRAAEHGIALIDQCSSDLPRVLADPVRLKQIFLNLLENAIKFTPESGTVTVTASIEPENQGFVTLCVADTGIGIDPKATGQLFERLYQEKKGTPSSRSGLGLGLFICRELVVRQGGRIWAESEPGAGSRFNFTLPIDPQTDASEEPRRSGT